MIPAAMAAGGGAAAMAGSQVVSEVKHVFSELLDTVRNFGRNAISIVKECVGAFRPMELILFTNAVADLRAAVGSSLVPVLRIATTVVRQVADWFYNLSGPVKSLITNLAKITIIAGVAGAVIATLGTVAAGIAVLGAVAGSLLAPLVALVAVSVLIQAKTGQFGQALKLAEQAISFFVTGVQAVWEQLAPVRADLQAAFDELRVAFAELYEAVKPIAAVLVGSAVMAIKVVLKSLITGFTYFVQALTWVVSKVAKLISFAMKLAGLQGLSLPDLGSKDKNSFGIGQHSAEIGTDIGSLKTKLEQSIIEKQPTGDDLEEGQDAQDQAVTLLSSIDERIQNLPNSIARAIGEIAGKGAIGAALNPVGTVLGAIFGP